ncbi:hypothetical protein ACHQM5_004011 [Ranunculus cassubicifolius]
MATSSAFLHISTASSFTSTSKPKYQFPSLSYKPMKISMSQTQTSWAKVNSEVESHITHILADRKPETTYKPMDRLVTEVPRSMAPVLCIAACEAVGGDKGKAIPAASALHLMHVATYTHEYLQLSDDPSGELVTADHMVQLGYEMLSGMDDPSSGNSDQVLRVVIEVGRAMGSQGMVNGQYLKMMRLDQEEANPEPLLDEAFEKKGGALYSCGAACGAILGGGSDEEIEKLRKYGLYVGMIHNIMVHDGVGKEKRLLKLADNLRFLALKELEGMKEKNVEALSSIMDGFSAFLRVQKYQFPRRV